MSKEKNAFQRFWRFVRFWRTKEFKTRKSRRWAKMRSIDMDAFCQSIDADLWLEAKEFVAALHEKEASRWQKLSAQRIGGGGGYPFLYFLCRLMKPSTVVETGVAAGWSSAAVLTALEKNGHGHLYSSDLPYTDRPWSEAEVGILVNERHKSRWTLKIGPDSDNVPAILKTCGNIDIFHYDSDKSVAGRDAVFTQVQPRLSSQAVFIFDDIQDNFHFRFLVEERKFSYFVFEFLKKSIGVIVFGDALQASLAVQKSQANPQQC